MKPEEVKSKRIEKDISQSELARRTNLTVQTISCIERGVTQPTTRTMMKIRRILS